MALTDIAAFPDARTAARAIRIPKGVSRRVPGATLVLLAYVLWIPPVGPGLVTFILLKLWLSCFLLTKGLGLCIAPPAGSA